MNKSLRTSRGAVFSLRYHICWCTKYRAKLITPEIAHDLLDIIENIAAEKDFRIVAYKTDLDHVHLMIDCNPMNFIPDIMKFIKGRSSRILRQIHPKELPETGKPLWNPSYFIRTVSDVDNDRVVKYIERQGEA